ncbi:MAG TPA: hypothetical protein VIE66_02545 [Methylocella sp.]
MIALALVFTLSLAAAHAQDSRYGFVRAPYNYDDQYRRNEYRCPPWHPYQPGYHRCAGDDRRLDEGKGEPQ